MNWTTTTVPLWQIDCDSYRKTGRDFELRDVTTPEHLRFAEVFAARYDLFFEMTGTTIRFQRVKGAETLRTASTPSRTKKRT